MQDKMQMTVTFYVNIIILCFPTLAGYSNGKSIVVPPSKTTGLVGATVQLSCKVILGEIQDMKWEHNGAYIYSLINGKEEYPCECSKYEVKRIGSMFHLEIKTLALTDGGIVTCHNFVDTADAVLIVLDNPVLHIDPQDPVEGDSTTITCDASFGGPEKKLISPDHFPKLEMCLEGGPLPAAAIDDDKNSYNLHKEYNLSVSAHMDQDRITCMINTTHPAFSATTSTKLEVLYYVRNITYTPQLKQYEVGSNLTCTAQSNPPPVIEWENTANTGPFQGKQLLITESMVGPNQWKCTALNIIRGIKHEESVIAEFAVVRDYENISTDPVDDVSIASNYWIIGPILIVVLAVGMCAAFLFVKKWKQRRSETSTDSERGKGETSNRITNPNEMEEGQTMHSKDNDVTPDSEVDDSINNASSDASDKRSPSRNANAERNKDQQTCNIEVETKEEQPLLMPSHDKYKENESEDAREKQALATPSTNAHGELKKDQALVILEGSTHGQKSGPLDDLCQQIKLKEKHQELFRNQKSLLQLIQTCAADDNIRLRTEILNILVSNAEYISEHEVFIDWTEDFVLTLKALLDNGADPTWIPEDKFKTYTESAQYEFFGTMHNILLEKSYLYGTIEKVIPLFMAKECNMKKERYSTVLHALVNTDWKDINAKVKSLPPNFFTYYNNVIGEVIKSNPSIVDMQDEFCITPLHLYIQNLEIQESMINSVSNVVAKLKSDKNFNTIDCEGKTVLHYLTEAFPMFTTNVTKAGQDTFISMVKEITSDVNTCIQDKHGRTVLHVLAEKYSKGVPRDSKDMLCQLMKLWANKLNVDVQDLDRNTFLHILAKKYPVQVTKVESKDYLEIIKHVATLSNTNIPDKKGSTVLHVIAKTFDTFNQCKEIFTDLVIALANGADINIKNNDGNTILHIFAKKCANVSDSDAKTLLQLMTFLVEQCKTLAQDGKGRTMLHIMMENYLAKNNQSLIGNLVKMCVNKYDTIVNIQDDQENTVLHLLAGKFPMEVFAQNNNSEKYLEMIEDLATDITRDIKDKKGCTALQIVANNCKKDMNDCCKIIFPMLVKILKSPFNINFQDEKGSTVLHTIAKSVFYDPSLGNHILSTLPDITSQNVKTVDTNSVTPYSWILKGKDAYKDNREIQSMFIKIEKLFMMKGADSDVSKWELAELRDTAEDPSSPQQPLGNKINEEAVDELTNLLGSL